MKCELCEKDAVFNCRICRKPLCEGHIRLQAICTPCIKKSPHLDFRIEKVTSDKERYRIRDFVRSYWGEEEQLSFDRKLMVAELPAYVSKVNQEIAGFIAFTELNDAMLIVALGVLPRYQGQGMGKNLTGRVETEARKLHKNRLLVSTSNDDLPALAFYQNLGFRIFEVKPNVIAEKHGKILKGIAGLPVRDELRLQKTLL